MRNIAIRVGLFLVVGAGALIARPFLTCYATRVDGKTTTGSIKKS